MAERIGPRGTTVSRAVHLRAAGILGGMFELTIEREFAAAHAIMIRGEREPVHGHNWRVTLTVGGDSLDEDGLLVDFHDLEAQLDDILAPFQNRHLNEVEPFDQVNPTAENVARHIAQAITPALATGVKLIHVSVTEAPGCRATYHPVR